MRRLELIGSLPPERIESPLTESGCAMRGRLGTFCIDDELNVRAVHGDIAHRLGCDSFELNQQGWRPYLLPDDMPEAERLAADLKARRFDEYRVCAIAKSRERLYLRLQPYLMAAGRKPVLGGGIFLEMWESPRKFFVGSPIGRRRRAASLSRERTCCVLVRQARRRFRHDRRHPRHRWVSLLIA